MKKLTLCLALLLSGLTVFAQPAETEKTPAQKATDELAELYQLDAAQTAEMLKIQERKFRNLGEIEPLMKTDPKTYILKIRALQYAHDHSIRQLLNQEQLKTFSQQQIALREKKATTYKELKSAGASQQEIDWKMTLLDLESLQ